METFRAPEDYRPVVIFNPHSTRAGRVESEVVETLYESDWGRPKEIQTEYYSADDNAELIAANIREGDVLLACGGDGLAHSVANALRIRQDIKGNALMMPLPAGNACDISLSTYEKDILSEGSLVPTLERGAVHDADVINVETGDFGRWALGYASIGLTASLAELYSNDNYRLGRPIMGWRANMYDLSATWHRVWDSRPFRYEDSDSPESARQAHEIICLNTRRLAKLGNVAVSTFDGPITKEIPARGFGVHVVRSMVQLVSGEGLRGELLESRQLTIRQTEGAVPYQVDGEVSYLQYGDTVKLAALPAAVPVIGPAL